MSKKNETTPAPTYVRVPVDVLKAHLLVASKETAARPILASVAIHVSDEHVILVSTDSYGLLATSGTLEHYELMARLSGMVGFMRAECVGLVSRDVLDRALKLYASFKYKNVTDDWLPVLAWDSARGTAITVGVGNDETVMGSTVEGEYARVNTLIPDPRYMSTGGGELIFKGDMIERIGKIGKLLGDDTQVRLMGSTEGAPGKPQVFLMKNGAEGSTLLLQMTAWSKIEWDVKSRNIVDELERIEAARQHLEDELNLVTEGDYKNLPADEYHARWHPQPVAS